MPKIVSPATEIVHRQVFELRYSLGHLFWDRCGRILNELLRKHEEWDFQEMQTGAAIISQKDKNLAFAYSWQKADLQQAQSAELESVLPIGEFAALADAMTSVVVKTIEVEDFPRIGFRSWYLYATESKERTAELIQKLKAFPADEEAMAWLGTASDVSHRIVVERPKHTLMISISAFEQHVPIPAQLEALAKAQARKASRQQDKIRMDALRARRLIEKYPEYGLLVDLDASIEFPPFPDDLSASGFIENAQSDFMLVRDYILQSRG